ncbi:aminotransferase class III-fold pyridoxal phosphate-dependent enzyme [Dankookia rubra]|uniref:Aminotransferase class III-fold pyridoxal phosphate-dependent enzyme n=1 Tax=Dankookia rubra TaxID=1442381 RepID=A0A4R5QA75_9PROT|nr:aminotransferase class III-fold pyridoxal phosphate-dependent enzyme [Dankookia rubra]TDH59940.1 aminotransferase class III-fold pyridoxal phosphate-dependent enzyme [Dankookia rubra]
MDHPAATNAEPTDNQPPFSRSAAEFERAKRVIPGGSMRQATWFAPHPPYAVRGEGCWVEDLDGRRILDCANNFFSLVHGHAFPPVVEALRKVVGDGTAFGMPTRHETALAEAIRSRSPRCEQIRFCNSGTEAVMFAVKAARALTGRPAIAKFEGAYHGSYDSLEVSLGSDPSNWDGSGGDPAAVPYDRGTPAGVVADTVVLPYADADRCTAILEREAPRIAAVVLDPLASKIGMVPPPAATIEAIRNAGTRHGILLICDEVITFRLSHAGAHPLFGLEPDLIALGKIIGGGLPVGAVAGPAARMAIFDHTRGQPPVAFGGTFSANPLTMAAGLAALDAFDLPAVDRLNRLGDTLRSRVNAAFTEAGVAAQMTGFGSLFRLHLTAAPIRDYRSCYPDAAAKKALAAIHLTMLDAGVLLTPNCSGALSTPMAAAEISLIAHALVEATLAERTGR